MDVMVVAELDVTFGYGEVDITFAGSFVVLVVLSGIVPLFLVTSTGFSSSAIVVARNRIDKNITNDFPMAII